MPLHDDVAALQEEIQNTVLSTPAEAEAFRLRFLSGNGIVKGLMGRLKEAAPEDRRAVGQLLNGLKTLAEQTLAEAKERLEAGEIKQASAEDFTLPPIPGGYGTRHPLTLVRDKMLAVFRQIGFSVSDGPEIEDDWHNFSALNFPPDHPAREMQDTFFIRRAEGPHDPDSPGDILLRTHTSPVQIRALQHAVKTGGLPIRTLSPGRVYRNEAISARAHCVFHQIEGLYVDKGVSFVDLKETVYYFARTFFAPETQIRFRASYFPFTEPSAEIDISCQICHGSGCGVCKHTGWVEIAGSGMVHPNVLRACGIDPDVYSGFAFGMGVERTAMLKYQVRDLRLYTENDLRFLQQFASVS